VDAWDDLVLVGIIARPQGHRGEVIVNPETDFPERRFVAGGTLWMREGGRAREVLVRTARMHQGRPVVRLEGVDTMNDAERLRGVELRVPEQSLSPLPEGRHYRHQLLGCDVVGLDGAAIGRVTGINGAAGGEHLVVASAGGEVLIPLVEGICRSIDVSARCIVVDPPEGLLDLNVTGSRRR
jgi:16S rRNA processing protein RimM